MLVAGETNRSHKIVPTRIHREREREREEWERHSPYITDDDQKQQKWETKSTHHLTASKESYNTKVGIIWYLKKKILKSISQKKKNISLNKSLSLKVEIRDEDKIKNKKNLSKNSGQLDICPLL